MKLFLRVAFAGWFAASVLGLAFMCWQGWATTGSVYGGLDLSAQRALVAQRYGMGAAMLVSAEAASRELPEAMRYRLSADYTKFSYAAYILAPRVLDDRAGVELGLDGGDRVVVAAPGTARTFAPPNPAPPTETPPFAWGGWLLAPVLSWGLGVVFSRFFSGRSGDVAESAVAGMAVGCVLACASKVFWHDARPGMWAWAVLGGAGAVWATAARLRAWRVLSSLARPRKPPGHSGRVASACAILACGFAAWSFLMAVWTPPDEYDCWGIWGPKAKVLALGEGPLGDATAFGHRDYPPLWPSLWAFSSFLSGGWEDRWSKGIGAVLFLLASLRAGRIVREETGSQTAGALAAGCFASIPYAARVASWGYAEPVLWIATVCAFGRLMAWRREGGAAHVVLAGLFSACAAMAKNDGMMFVAVAGAWVAWRSFRQRRWVPAAAFLPPFLLFFGWWFWTRRVLGVGSYHLGVLARGGDLLGYAGGRLWGSLAGMASVWGDLRMWNLAPLALLFPVVMLVARHRPRVGGWFIPVGVFLGLWAVVLLHPGEIRWQMTYSWDRLTLQFLPPWIVLAFRDGHALVRARLGEVSRRGGLSPGRAPSAVG